MLEVTCLFLIGNSLVKRCKENEEMVSRGGLEFVMNLSKLLDRLFDFRSIAVVEHEVNNDLRMHVMFNLLVSLFFPIHQHSAI